MDPLLVVCLGLGLVGGVIAGTLGIGGGIVMAPLLLYVPPLVHAGSFDMRSVAGLTMFQSLAATASGVLAHRRRRCVDGSLVVWLGSTAAIATFVGAYLSRWASSRTLLLLFTMLALVAAVLLLAPDPHAERDWGEERQWNRRLGVACLAAVGLLGGLVGQSGAFIIVPILLRVLKIPTRVALGSSLGIVFLAALAGVAGKAATAQIPPGPALGLAAGAVIGGQVGALISHRLPTAALRTGLAVLVLGTAVRIWADLLTHG
ncbi:MAG: sulfite exporter TauE/SafE family protein [Armatimonadetes bacterium]|nr:sulfite exporter TauE/SafE family protein [Armatimonadota bacterium]